MKKNARVDKGNFLHDLTEEAEMIAGKRDLKRLYKLPAKSGNPSKLVRNKDSIASSEGEES